MIDRAILEGHLDYSAWASQRLVAAAATLGADELTRDFGTADRSVLGTLVHVYAADRVWLGRVEGRPPATFVDPEIDMHLSVLQHEWPALIERWKGRLRAEPDTARVVDYQDLKGNPYRTPLWQILLHLVNHGTHHRGQVSGFLRSMGHTPPPTDLIAYYRLGGGPGVSSVRG